MKKLATIILMALVVAGVIAAILKTNGPQPRTAGVGEESVRVEEVLPSDGVVVTYFTTNVRCPSCRQIEQLTREAVDSRASASGQVVRFRLINTDEPNNQHYIDDYRLVSKTVIVATLRGGKETQWRNLQDVWLKLDDHEDFRQYVVGAIESALNDPAT